MIGQTLAHYKVLKKIGSGGMGEVYLAEDTKLDRKVALKVLPPELAENEERRARFTREAKALAALNHPNIVTVHSVELADEVHFITMELVKEKTLTELLSRSGLSLAKFFEIAIPLADAVAAAHQEGITHRDLKPDNVMKGDDGRIKVLDFGLAKPQNRMGSIDSELPTEQRTREGRILGTIAYMSPEQAEGKPVDALTDIFSLGIVFYEMLTGSRPFQGETSAAILSSIIKDEPAPVRKAHPEVPREISRLVHRCLAKQPRKRIQTALDIGNELEELKQDLASGELVEAALIRKRSPTVTWPGVATATLAVAVVGVLFYFIRPFADNIPRFTNPVQITSAAGVEIFPAWSPDGAQLAFQSDQSGNFDIWVAHLGGGAPVNRTEGRAAMDTMPSWSPDGSQIAFVSEPGDVWVMPAVGGEPRKLISRTQHGGSAPQWSADGSELAVSFQAPEGWFVEVISLRSLETRRVSLPSKCLEMAWSPDGRFFACVDVGDRTYSVTQLWLQPASGGGPILVSERRTRDYNPTWSHNGRYLFFVSERGGSMDLWRQGIGADGRPEGDAERLSVALETRTAAFSPDGNKITYSRGFRVGNVWRVPLLENRPATWEDAQQVTFGQDFIATVRLSADQSSLLLTSDRAGNDDVWRQPIAGGEMSRMTVDPTLDWSPCESPDGTEIVFHSFRSGDRDIWVMPAQGGPARVLAPHPAMDRHPSWSPDGREIAYDSNRGGHSDIWVVPAEGGDARQVTDDASEDIHPVWSPDGDDLIFSSNREDGIRRLWRVPARGGEAVRLSAGPGYSAYWSVDGKTLYFGGQNERADNIWALSAEDGTEHPVTDLSGRYGRLEPISLDTDREYLYFIWAEDLGDIWVMDVATDESK